MFERIATVLDAHGKPRDPDDVRSAPQRQAEGLAEICGYALAHGSARVLPDTGGRRPQVVVTVRLEDLEQRARTGLLEFGGQTSAATLRKLACDAAVIPVVLSGAGQPLDVGRSTRTVPDGMRRAVTARDLGCAHPGCDRPPSWCELHHIIEWAQGGDTALDNLVMLCSVHHRLVHHSGWEVRIAEGRPEFVPPGWIDPKRRPRRKPDLLDCVADPAGRSRVPVPRGAPGAELADAARSSASATECPAVNHGDPEVRIADFTDLPVRAEPASAGAAAP